MTAIRRAHGQPAAALALLAVLALAVPAFAAPGSGGQDAAAAAPAPDADRPLTLKRAGRDFLDDAGRIWSSPARIKGRDIVPIFALAAGAALLVASDEAIRDGVQEWTGRHAWAGDAAPVITRLGDLGAGATAGIFFGVGLLVKDARARDTGYLAASAMLQTFLVDNVLKGLSGRRRPSFADGEDHWAGPAGFIKRYEAGQSDAYTSFPSGHSAAAFALATVIALQYRRPLWAPIAAYTLAAGVGLSRMVMDRHWASDVVLGALVGHLVARLVVRNHVHRGRLAAAVACSGRGLALSVVYHLDR